MTASLLQMAFPGSAKKQMILKMRWRPFCERYRQGIGATIEKSMYISPNSFPGLVDSQKIPRAPAPFCRRHRGSVSFSGKIFNTIEKVTPHFAKVTRFLGPFATRVGPGRHRTDKTRHFRHMRHRFPDSVGTSGETFPTLSRK